MSGIGLNSPACLAIRAWLVENRGTVAEIVAATGYGLSTVERSVGLLRKAEEPQALNVMPSKKGPPVGVKRQELERRRAEREAQEAVLAQEEQVRIVATALQSRTLLEQLWAAQA
jgi:hypothetical protein